MFIKAIVIDGVEGDVEIARTETGALVTAGSRIVCHLEATDDPRARYAKAVEAAKAVLGTDRKGRVNATNSMVHEVLAEIERVVGWR